MLIQLYLYRELLIFAIVNLYQNILAGKQKGEKLLAVLIDPEKTDIKALPSFFEKIHRSVVTHIFVGGSTDKEKRTEEVVITIKNITDLPVILFPGDYTQITHKADGILFLSLISGRNPEYLIEQQVQSIPVLKESGLEIMPTAYILIDGGVETSVQRISNTKPIAQDRIDLIVNTAIAGVFSGKKLVYLEAGSGANKMVNQNIIKAVKRNISVPLIVGGGICSKEQLELAYTAGADLVVIGTAFEKNTAFFEKLKT